MQKMVEANNLDSANKREVTHLNLSMSRPHIPNIEKILSPYLNLIVLNLNYNNLSNEQIELLALVLGNLNKLQRLELSYNDIDDEGIEKLAPALRQLTQLRILNLSSNGHGIRSEDVANLAKALEQLTQLQHLDISENSLRDSMGVLANILRHSSTLISYKGPDENNIIARVVERNCSNPLRLLVLVLCCNRVRRQLFMPVEIYQLIATDFLLIKERVDTEENNKVKNTL